MINSIVERIRSSIVQIELVDFFSLETFVKCQRLEKCQGTRLLTLFSLIIHENDTFLKTDWIGLKFGTDHASYLYIINLDNLRSIHITFINYS